jgi:hypothetical protein
MKYGMGLLVALCLLAACGNNPDCSTDGLPAVQLDIVRHDQLLAQFAEQATDTVTAQTAFATLIRPERYQFARLVYGVDSAAYDSVGPRADTALALDLYLYTHVPQFRALQDSIAQYWPTNHDFRTELEEPFRRFRAAFPQVPLPHIRIRVENADPGLYWQVAYENLRADWDTATNTLALALDYFCHPKFPTLPPDLPKYIRRFARPDQLAPAALLEMLQEFTPTPDNRRRPTLMDHLVVAGIRQYALQQLLPCVPDSVRLGFGMEQLGWCEQHEPQIYEHLLPLLYETDPNTIEPYYTSRPNTGKIAPECPGRIADWVGLQIVRRYMQKMDGRVTLAQLAAQRDYRAVFEAANYKP